VFSLFTVCLQFGDVGQRTVKESTGTTLRVRLMTMTTRETRKRTNEVDEDQGYQREDDDQDLSEGTDNATQAKTIGDVGS
jgi:hypothetical protein